MIKKQQWALIMPTESSNAQINRLPNGYLYRRDINNQDMNGMVKQHLYIVSLDQPKVGDYMTNGVGIYKNSFALDAYIGLYPIIASTDESLGVLNIPNEFIDDFIRNNGSKWKVETKIVNDELNIERIDVPKLLTHFVEVAPVKEPIKIATLIRKILIWFPILGMLLALIEFIILTFSKDDNDDYNFFKTNHSVILLNVIWLGLTGLIFLTLLLCNLYQSNPPKFYGN